MAGSRSPTPAATEVSPGPIQVEVDGAPLRLWVFDVGLACCAVEFVAALTGGALRRVTDATTGAFDVAVDVLVVSGTVTDKVAPAVRALYEQTPEPRFVLSFGACANTGGPYWDSYCVTKGVDTIVPVDVYVPGCPPRPEALADGLRLLAERARTAVS